MRIKNSLRLLLISAHVLLANTEKVTFKVLAPNGTPLVNVNYKQYPMDAVPDKNYLYQTVVDINEFPVNYNYIINYGDENYEQEEFTRQRSQGDDVLNEFFGRSVTIKEHPLLPKAYEDFPYAVKSKLFNDNFVASIFVTCDPNELEEMHNNVESEKKINAVVTYASPYDVKTFKEAVISLCGQSTINAPKLSYKIKNLTNEKKKELYGRSSIKLRAEHMDPSLLREKLYGDILNTLGVPSTQNTFARLYINGKPIGLFNLSDDPLSKRYLRNTFNKGKKFDVNNPNPFYKADAYDGLVSDLSYNGDDASQDEYKLYSYKGDDKTKTEEEHIQNELIPLFKEIDAYISGERDNISLDIDSFLKYMAMEFLGGGIDNFWVSQSNYLLFKDLAQNKWYFHDIDFHYTFGTNWNAEDMLNTPLSEYPPAVENESKDRKRPLIDAIRSHPEEEAKFKQIFERLLKTSFHTNAIFPRLESLTNLIREDAHWDVSLEKQNKNPTTGKNSHYTSQDFENEATSEQEKGFDKGFPIRYFIKNKVKLISNELGIQIPYDFESDLGFVEVLSLNDESYLQKSNSIKSVSWNIFSIILTFIIAIIL